EWQLRVAAGEPLPLTQQHIRMQGHAFEARIYAEDPAKGFIPATGRLDLLELPERIARIDSGVRAGDEISPFYDPMIAKLTVHAADRRTALNTLASSLRETRIAGCTTNVAFLYRLANHQGFASGDVDTGLIERELDSLVASERPAAELIAAAAMASCGLLTTTGQTDPWDTLRGWRQWSEARQFTHLIWRDEPITCQLCSHASGELDVVFDDRSLRLEVLEIDNNRVRLRIDGHSIALHVLLQACCVTIFHDAVAWRFELPDQLSDNDDSTASEDTLLAPMPGKIIAVMAGPGASVKAGERLLVMEAMKMEHTLTAPRDGTIAEITVKPGDQVSDGTLLISLAEQAT
ncbi:MAG: 3-methylcrotonyl-CoA carboxylase, partial [Gammaproteobacteria bacterium]|nr:3-methylcrotonyl-CoA carboxylase [Gammaproteobacteria bacterium]